MQNYVSAGNEKLYLRRFLHIRNELKSHYGKRISTTLMITLEDSLAWRTLHHRLRLYRGYYEPEKREGIS